MRLWLATNIENVGNNEFFTKKRQTPPNVQYIRQILTTPAIYPTGRLYCNHRAEWHTFTCLQNLKQIKKSIIFITKSTQQIDVDLT